MIETWRSLLSIFPTPPSSKAAWPLLAESVECLSSSRVAYLTADALFETASTSGCRDPPLQRPSSPSIVLCVSSGCTDRWLTAVAVVPARAPTLATWQLHNGPRMSIRKRPHVQEQQGAREQLFTEWPEVVGCCSANRKHQKWWRHRVSLVMSHMSVAGTGKEKLLFLWNCGTPATCSAVACGIADRDCILHAMRLFTWNVWENIGGGLGAL